MSKRTRTPVLQATSLVAKRPCRPLPPYVAPKAEAEEAFVEPDHLTQSTQDLEPEYTAEQDPYVADEEASQLAAIEEFEAQQELQKEFEAQQEAQKVLIPPLPTLVRTKTSRISAANLLVLPKTESKKQEVTTKAAKTASKVVLPAPEGFGGLRGWGEIDFLDIEVGMWIQYTRDPTGYVSKDEYEGLRQSCANAEELKAQVDALRLSKIASSKKRIKQMCEVTEVSDTGVVHVKSIPPSGARASAVQENVQHFWDISPDMMGRPKFYKRIVVAADKPRKRGMYV